VNETPEQFVIRPALDTDRDAIWSIFNEVVALGDTYAFAPDTTRDEALVFWVHGARATYVLESEGEVVGTYFLKTNMPGLGAHVCNAGYMVAAAARGRGYGRAMCEHSLDEARRLGYHAMQYNLVVSTNEGAIRLWKRLGFDVVGRLPAAFRHADLGFVDALVMYRSL
jgi:L-amino acid N-acyltransferase YncA